MVGEVEGKLFIQAANVHTGGGQFLLNALLQVVANGRDVVAVLDTRMVTTSQSPDNLKVRRVQPSVWYRLKAEWWLARNVEKGDIVLCFGNLPPLFRLRGRAVVFVQNRYLIDAVSLGNFPVRTRLRLTIERLWLFWKAANARAFVVQTPSMQTLLQSSKLVRNMPVHVLPFVNQSKRYERVRHQHNGHADADAFIYVASGEPHKNHRRLVDAWSLLANEGLLPSLWLTLDTRIHADLCLWVDQQKSRLGLRIENLGVQPHGEIVRLYTKAMALIYPSTFESFGIPLIEARQAGLPVLASELDFVRDVLDPEQVFDPYSSVSIARAVKRFLCIREDALPLMDASEFLKRVMKECA